MLNALTPQTGERMMETSLWDSPSSSSDPRLSFSFYSYSRSSTFSFCVLKRLRHGVSHLRLILYYNVRRTLIHTHARARTNVRNEATIEQNGMEKIKVEGEVEVKRNCKWKDGRNGAKERGGEERSGEWKGRTIDRGKKEEESGENKGKGVCGKGEERG